ncbi:ComEA family DNA-binding protein [Occallatibacter savannae]|uniref:ComEA family DNA-binding protein n=1 Tax=Occallatibacter savannae TaxID=1002691 RepID=UPI0013A54564|nr:helix-hairpin-helix domain-containing protein [Occallatibacter savannae]
MTLHARLLTAITVAAFTTAASALHPAVTRHSQPVATHDTVPSEPVDINTASLDRLTSLPGLGRVWAARIIRYRPYRGKNELLDRGVIPAGVYARIRDSVIAHRQAR